PGATEPADLRPASRSPPPSRRGRRRGRPRRAPPGRRGAPVRCGSRPGRLRRGTGPRRSVAARALTTQRLPRRPPPPATSAREGVRATARPEPTGRDCDRKGGSVVGGLVARGIRLAAARARVGDVVTRSLEDDATGVEYLLELATALGMDAQRLVGELLEHLQAFSAVLALILVRGHVRVT